MPNFALVAKALFYNKGMRAGTYGGTYQCVDTASRTPPRPEIRILSIQTIRSYDY